MKEDIKSLLFHELSERLAEMGQPAYRAGQIFKWLHGGAASFSEMTDMPKALRESLDSRFYITAPALIKKQESTDETVKYLWRLEDGNAVESVVMRYKHGNSICISTQVGCRMGCKFCASAIGGLVRDLRASEMLDQVLAAQKDLEERISNVVLMGIGEPFDNFENVTRFLSLVTDSRGVNIGMRHISVSTCGLVEKVDKLGEDKLQFTLSVSLHAPDDETRTRLMPVNKAYGVEKLLASCRRYFDLTGRRISFEYAMIDGINDTPRQARLLAQKLKGTGSHLNLIRLNNVEESDLKPSSPEHLKEFVRILRENGVNVTVRRRLGGDIDASCGQLRKKEMRPQA